MAFSIFLLTILLTLAATAAPAPAGEYRYYLRSNLTTTTTASYISSSITYNGHTNYVLLTNASLAQPLTLSPADGSITLDTSNVIGASSHAPLLLSAYDGFAGVYKQVLLGDEKAGEYTKGFSVGERGELRLDMEGFGGFVACAAARGVRQVYWERGRGGEVLVSCERVGFGFVRELV